ncbi:MAG: hypothetical protein NVS9B10_24480 [Nevskia sp.]
MLTSRARRLWAAVVAVLGLGLFPMIAQAHFGTLMVNCSQAVFAYHGFGDSVNEVGHETVTVDGVLVATRTFTWMGGDATDIVPISVPAGSHFVVAHTDFSYTTPEGVNQTGSSDYPAYLTCSCSSFVPNTDTAVATGQSYVIAATLLGTPVIQPGLAPSASSKTGLGTDAHATGPLVPINLPGPISIGLLQSSSAATITSTGSTNESTATTGAINLLNMVSATALKADARAFASPTDATYSTAGSEIEGLIVAGAPVNSIHPNQVIPLPGGGTVTLLEQTASTSSTNGGRNKSDLSINLIHIRIPAVKVGTVTVAQASDIIVGHAEAHADALAATVCPGDPLSGSVSAEAFAASVSQGLDPELNTIRTDDIAIPATGGSGSVAAHGFHVVLGGQTVGSGTVSEQVDGVTGTSSSTASASATVQSLCLFSTTACDPVHGVYPTDGIGLSAATADSRSTANGTAASSSPTGTTLATLSLAGQIINPLTVPPNTTYSIPGLLTVIVNEQIPEAGSNTTTDTGLTVNLLHIRLMAGGADVIISSAHSDAHHK